MKAENLLQTLLSTIAEDRESKNELLYSVLPRASRTVARLIFRTALGLHPTTLGVLIDDLPKSVLAAEYRTLHLLLYHTDEHVRSSVVERLAESKRTATLLSLRLLEDKSYFVRAAALQGLLDAGKLTLAAVVECADNDPSRWVRAKAAGIAVTRFLEASQQSNLAKLSLSRDKVVASMAISYLDEALDKELLAVGVTNFLKKNFNRVRPGLDDETRESIEFIGRALGIEGDTYRIENAV